MLDLVNKTIVIQGRYNYTSYSVKGLVTKQIKSTGSIDDEVINVITYVRLYKPYLTTNIGTTARKEFNYVNMYSEQRKIINNILNQAGPYFSRNTKENIYFRTASSEVRIVSINGKSLRSMYGDNILFWPKEIISLVTGIRNSSRTVKEIIEARNFHHYIGYFNPSGSNLAEEEFFPDE